MKKLFFITFLLIAVNTFLWAQKKPAVIKKQVAVKPILQNLDDTVSYALGSGLANYYKSQGIKKINASLVAKAINDIMSAKTPIFDDNTANLIMNKCMTKIQEEKVKPAIDAGNAFLSENKKRPGVKTTASGLQYEVITEGTGAKPEATDSVTCNYRGTLINGTEFDNSFSRGQPITFSLNKVIRGWTEGLQLMTVGSKYKLYIPYTLGYGYFDNGPIPGGSALVFEVELLNVKKANPGN